MKIAIFLPILFLIQSCVTQPLSTDKIYRKDMLFQVQKNTGSKADDFNGIGVMDKRPSYTITFNFFKKPDQFKLTTCHREIVAPNPGWSYKYVYGPIAGIEDVTHCPIKVGAFDMASQHSWGYIDFIKSHETLSAVLFCNGDNGIPMTGLSICQSRAGLIQKIRFTEATEYKKASAECPSAEVQNGGKDFLIELGRGECVYSFRRGKDFHRLVTFGYDDVILR